MNFKKLAVAVFLVFSLFSAQEIFAQVSNSGFVSGNIWYSKDPFEEGDKIRIYTFIFNPDARELSGTVIFFDKTVLLAKKDFSIPGGRAEDVFVNWTVNAGDHAIFAKIENARFLISPGKYEEVNLAENETEKSSREVSKKIIPKPAEDTETSGETDNFSFVSDVKNIVEENTPDFIKEEASIIGLKLEELRENIGEASKEKREEIRSEIKTLSNEKIELDSDTAKNTLIKPFKYAELFFLSVSTFIVQSKTLFYGLSILIIFFILRYIWRIVF